MRGSGVMGLLHCRSWDRPSHFVVCLASPAEVGQALPPANRGLGSRVGRRKLGSCELHGGCCCEVLARFVISRHGTGSDVIYPAMQGEITLRSEEHTSELQ